MCHAVLATTGGPSVLPSQLTVLAGQANGNPHFSLELKPRNYVDLRSLLAKPIPRRFVWWEVERALRLHSKRSAAGSLLQEAGAGPTGDTGVGHRPEAAGDLIAACDL